MEPEGSFLDTVLSNPLLLFILDYLNKRHHCTPISLKWEYAILLMRLIIREVVNMRKVRNGIISPTYYADYINLLGENINNTNNEHRRLLIVTKVGYK